MASLVGCACEAIDCVCSNLMPYDESECDECHLGQHTYPWDEDFTSDWADGGDDWLDR